MTYINTNHKILGEGEREVEGDGERVIWGDREGR